MGIQQILLNDYFLYFSFSHKAKKITRHMSVNQQHLDPDSTTDVEDVTGAEEELIKKCEEMWKDMEEVSIKT